MKRDEYIGLTTAVVTAVIVGSWTYGLTKNSTSDYWKTEIVRHGAGTWETTPNGQVWFKWKEAQ